jgi:hypothetical protein
MIKRYLIEAMQRAKYKMAPFTDGWMNCQEYGQIKGPSKSAETR